MALSSMAVAKAKPRDKQYKLNDGRGLYLLLTPQGGRYWRLNYRFDGKWRTMALGVFPDVSLADARSLLAQGIDPTAKRKEVAAQAAFDATTPSKPLQRNGLPSVSAKAWRKARSTKPDGCWISAIPHWPTGKSARSPSPNF